MSGGAAPAGEQRCLTEAGAVPAARSREIVRLVILWKW